MLMSAAMNAESEMIAGCKNSKESSKGLQLVGQRYWALCIMTSRKVAIERPRP